MSFKRGINSIPPVPRITCERKSISISCKIRNLKISYNQIQRLFLQMKEAMIEMKWGNNYKQGCMLLPFLDYFADFSTAVRNFSTGSHRKDNSIFLLSFVLLKLENL